MCCVESCGRKHCANNYCEKHNRQVKKHGHILDSTEISEHMRFNRAHRKIWNGWSDEAKKRNAGKQVGVQKNTGRTHFKPGVAPWCKGIRDWLSPEHKEALRRANLGRTPWNKGKTHLAKDNNPAWKGGTSSQNNADRVRFRRFYQKLVFQRDNFTCQMCDQYAGYLQVDHIKRWADYPELRFELNNCRTLCMACHYYITFKRKIPEGIIWGHNLSRRIG